MKNHTTLSTIFAVVTILCLTAKAGANSAATDSNAPAKPAAEVIAVIVNGVEITESEIEADIKPQADKMIKRAQERKVPPDVVERYRKQFVQQAIEAKVTQTLLDAEVKKNKITTTEKEVTQELEKMASKQNLSMKDFKELVEASGQSFDKLKERTKKRLLYDKLMDTKFADKTKVSDKEAQDFYKNNLARFSTRRQVKASHILIKPDTSDPKADPNEAKAKAKAKAETLLKQIKAGADFAKLAEKNSDCPSAKKGGDLGFFHRGDMVPEFEEAAFRQKAGDISGVVETEFGYHIIKTTENTPSKVTTFEQAKDNIVEQLKNRKQSEFINKYIESLRTSADIVYPSAKEPENKSIKLPVPAK